MSYSVNCSILLTELPLLERAAAAKAAGFDAVEFWWPFAEAVPNDKDLDDFIRSIEDAGVQLAGLNFFAGDMPAGDRGLVSWKGRCSEFKDNVDVVAGIGERLGTRAFNALYGNRQEDFTAEEQDVLALKNLLYAAEGIGKIGGTVLLEPVSGTPAYPLKTAADTYAVINKVKEAGAENLRFLADFYHLSVNGDDVAAVIEQHAADFGHVQIADSPGRGAPGTGELPLSSWVTRTQELGYNGHIALEYKQPIASAFSWLGR